VRSYAKSPALTSDFSEIECWDDSRRFEAGNLDYAGIAAIGAGAKLLNTLAVVDIERHILELEDRLIEGIGMLPLQFRSPLEMEGIALIAGVDRIADMFRTTLNVLNDLAVTAIVAHWENGLNRKIYYGEEKAAVAAD